MGRILIIEDNLSQCALYAEEFAGDGYEVVCAPNGLDALEIFKLQRPDLVITDILLPGMTGIEIMERMLAIEPGLPIIIHTAYSSPRLDFIAGIARAYVMKSGNLDELKHQVRAVLTKHESKIKNNELATNQTNVAS